MALRAACCVLLSGGGQHTSGPSDLHCDCMAKSRLQERSKPCDHMRWSNQEGKNEASEHVQFSHTPLETPTATSIQRSRASRKVFFLETHNPARHVPAIPLFPHSLFKFTAFFVERRWVRRGFETLGFFCLASLLTIGICIDRLDRTVFDNFSIVRF